MKSILVALLLCFTFASPFGYAATESATKTEPQAQMEPQPEIADIITGDPKAPVLLVEYSSLNCAHCAGFHKNFFPELEKKYFKTGKVSYALKHFPLDYSAVEYMTVIAKQPKEQWFPLVKKAFKTQKDWVGKDMKAFAKAIGVSQKSCTEALKCDTTKQMVLAKRFNAEQIVEIDATPTFLILYEHKGELQHVLYNQGVNRDELMNQLDTIYKKVTS